MPVSFKTTTLPPDREVEDAPRIAVILEVPGSYNVEIARFQQQWQADYLVTALARIVLVYADAYIGATHNLR